MNPASPRYTRTAVALHWLLAILLIGQFAFGWYLQGIERGIPARAFFVNLHKSSGILLGLLILLRLGWRLTHRPPALPGAMPAWQRRAAVASHDLIYALMLVMPLSGYLASNFSKWGVNFFNRWKWAPWGIESPAAYAVLNGVHVAASWLLLVLVTVHVLAALKHLLVNHDGVFQRMWPTRASRL